MANILLRLLIGRAGERKNCDIMRKICILCKGLYAGNIQYRFCGEGLAVASGLARVRLRSSLEPI
ncbi:hypothetical protein, partial [Pseudomonas syringae]